VNFIESQVGWLPIAIQPHCQTIYDYDIIKNVFIYNTHIINIKDVIIQTILYDSNISGELVKYKYLSLFDEINMQYMGEIIREDLIDTNSCTWKTKGLQQGLKDLSTYEIFLNEKIFLLNSFKNTQKNE